jgi:3'-phosphoadenosine 5'-phosphosulfate sulfotransferase (PAPS reductase)/FAD synthetase
MKDYIVVSFSGGKDSTAMLLRMIELGEHIDEVVCCDTYKEFPAMYRHIEKVKKVVEDAGIKFTMLKADKSFDYFMFNHEIKPRKGNVSRVGYSWADSRSRWCTTLLKISVIDRYFKNLQKQCNVIQCVGIAADESYRLDRKNNQQENMRHPLVKWGWVEDDCLKYCYSKGYDWEGLYEIFKKEGRTARISCWCCPLQSLEDLRKLRKHFPDLWDELKDMDARTWRQFRADYSVEDLEKRFVFEEERLAQGLSITNRDFHQQLKERLGKGGIAK